MSNTGNALFMEALTESLRLLQNDPSGEWLIAGDLGIRGVAQPYETEQDFEKKNVKILHTFNDYCLKVGICINGSSLILLGNRTYEFNQGSVVLALPGELRNEFPREHENYCSLWIGTGQNDALAYIIRKNQDEIKYTFDVYGLESYMDYHTLLGSIEDELKKGLIYPKAVRDCLIQVKNTVQGIVHDRAARDKFGKGWMKYQGLRIKRYIEDNYTKDIKLDEIAQEINVSTRYLYTIFKPMTGKTMLQYIEYLRIAKAREILRSTDRSTRSIALQLGYYDEYHFSKVFKKETGCTPAQYRKNKGISLQIEFPRVYLDTEYSPPKGNIIALHEGDDLQAALDTARLGDTIILQAGAVFAGCFFLPQKTGEGWIYIQSSSYSMLPAPGNRVSPDDAACMPKIVTEEAENGAAINAINGAHHYRFVGIELTCTHAATTSVLTEIVKIHYDDTDSNDVSSKPPHDIVLDRCYIHGTPTGSLKRGVTMNGARLAVIDSYISECHDISASSQAILSYLGPGPFKIVNNYLESSGENILFGGERSFGPTSNPSDIEIRQNNFYKPLSWCQSHRSYKGTHWVIQNLFEIKNAQRVLVEGNIFENNWLDAYSGYAIWIKLEDESTSNWHVCQDIIFTNNIIRNTASGFIINGYSAVGSSKPHNWGQRLLIKNNLINNEPEWEGIVTLFKIINNFSGITIEHNTFCNAASIIVCDGLPNYGFAFKNNIKACKYYVFGAKGVDCGDGNDTLNYYFPGFEFEGNIIVKGEASIFPAGNSFPNTAEEIGFVDFQNGDYRLSETSRYKNRSTDGRDPGADIDAVLAATAGVIMRQGEGTDE